MNEKTPGLNALIKAGARSRLTGNYPRVIFVQFYVGFLIAFLSELFFQMIKPSDPKGFCLFIVVRFLLTILSGLFLVGLNEMYISLFRGKKPSFLRLVTYFYQYSNKTIQLQLLILVHILLHAIPFLVTLPIWLILKKDILLSLQVLSFSQTVSILERSGDSGIRVVKALRLTPMQEYLR